MITRREMLKSAAVAVGALALPSVGVAARQPAKSASYWHPMGDAVGCDLCPNGCILNPGKTGRCRTRRNFQGALVTDAYANPCAVHNDPIEKKPLYHVLPGARAFSLAIAGCNLRCLNCQNYSISQSTPGETETVFLPPEKAVAEALRQGCRTIAYTYAEPVVWFEYVLETSRLARKAGLKNLWITNGYIKDAPLRELAPFMDAANINLKSFDERTYQKLNAGSLDPVLATIKNAQKYGIWVEITSLVIPGWTDDMTMFRGMCAWIRRNLGGEAPLHLLRFFPLYKLAGLYPTPAETLFEAQKIAREEGIKYVYIGNVAEADADTRCPACGKPVIVREGFIIKANTLKNGSCPHCKTPIKGIWS